METNDVVPKVKKQLDETIDLIQANWNEAQLKLRLWWTEFTEHDVAKLKGKTVELRDLLQAKYCYTKERAEIEIKKFVKSHGWDKP